MKPFNPSFNPSFNKLLDFIDDADDEPDDKIHIVPIIKLYGSLKSQMHVLLIRNYLDTAMADKLFEKLKTIKYNSDEQSMVKIMGKEFKIPRKQTAYGEPKTTYHFSGTSVQANDWSALPCEDFDKYNSDIRGMLKFVAKKAGCFDLFDGICQLTEPLTAFKQMCPKISAQTISKNRYTQFICNQC